MIVQTGMRTDIPATPVRTSAAIAMPTPTPGRCGAICARPIGVSFACPAVNCFEKGMALWRRWCYNTSGG